MRPPHGCAPRSSRGRRRAPHARGRSAGAASRCGHRRSGSAVLPSNTSTATGHPYSKPNTILSRRRRAIATLGQWTASPFKVSGSQVVEHQRGRSSGVGPDASRWCLGARAASPWRRRARFVDALDGASRRGSRARCRRRPARGGELRAWGEDARDGGQWRVRVRARRWRRGCGRAQLAQRSEHSPWPWGRELISNAVVRSATAVRAGYSTTTGGHFDKLARVRLRTLPARRSRTAGGECRLGTSMYMATDVSHIQRLLHGYTLPENLPESNEFNELY